MASKRPANQPTSASTPPADSFSLLFHNHPIPTCIYDLESLNFLEVNDAAVAKRRCSNTSAHRRGSIFTLRQCSCSWIR